MPAVKCNHGITGANVSQRDLAAVRHRHARIACHAHYEHDLSARLETRLQVGLPPFPHTLSDRFAVGLQAAFDRVVDHHKIRPPASYSAQHADCEVFTALRCLPLVGGLNVRCKRYTKCGSVFVDNVTHPATETFRQLRCMRRGDYCVVRMTRQIPRREQCRYVCRLRRSWRHENHEPRYVAALDCLQSVDEKFVVSCRLQINARQCLNAPRLQGAADHPPMQQQRRCLRAR